MEKVKAKSYEPNVLTGYPDANTDLTKGIDIDAIYAYNHEQFVCISNSAGAAKFMFLPVSQMTGNLASNGSGGYTLLFANSQIYMPTSERSITEAAATLSMSDYTNARLFVFCANFAQQCTFTFNLSYGIKHEFDTDTAKDVYKSGTNELTFKAGIYEIGGRVIGATTPYWTILAKKIAA